MNPPARFNNWTILWFIWTATLVVVWFDILMFCDRVARSETAFSWGTWLGPIAIAIWIAVRLASANLYGSTVTAVLVMIIAHCLGFTN